MKNVWFINVVIPMWVLTLVAFDAFQVEIVFCIKTEVAYSYKLLFTRTNVSEQR